MLDIILNFNKAQVSDFKKLISEVEQLLTHALNQDGLSYLVEAQISESNLQTAQICILHSADDGTKLSARMFV